VTAAGTLANIAYMLHDLTSYQTVLVVALVSIGIYPVGRAAQWGLWRAARWASCRFWGEAAARNVDMALHPDPDWKRRKTGNADPEN
jgi:hypothetical protein